MIERRVIAVFKDEKTANETVAYLSEHRANPTSEFWSEERKDGWAVLEVRNTAADNA